MEQIIENKGRIRIVPEGDFQCDENGNSIRQYKILSLVYDTNTKVSYVSKKDVPIGISVLNDEYWQSFQTVVVPKGDTGEKGDKGEDGINGKDGIDGISPLIRWNSSYNYIEQSLDNGETWYKFSEQFNVGLFIKGYVSSINKLPKNALNGDIYAVGPIYKEEDTDKEQPYYKLYINTVIDWKNVYTINKIYNSTSELPSSATDGTCVLVKKKVDDYCVYIYKSDFWQLIGNTAEIYVDASQIINKGDNIYALVQAEEPDICYLYKREIDWVEFGTYNSIQAGIVQHLTGNIDDTIVVPSVAAVNEYVSNNNSEISTINSKINALTLGAKVIITSNKSIIYLDEATTININATLDKVTSNKIDIKKNNTVLATSTNNNVSTTDNLTLTSNTGIASQIYKAVATYNRSEFENSVEILARYPIYYGFANTSNYPIKKLSARTSALGDNLYIDTATSDNQKFYILVPVGISVPTTFSMGGAPANFSSSQINYNNVSYTLFTSGATYNTGTTLTITAK